MLSLSLSLSFSLSLFVRVRGGEVKRCGGRKVLIALNWGDANEKKYRHPKSVKFLALCWAKFLQTNTQLSLSLSLSRLRKKKMKIDEVASTTKKARVATHTHIKVKPKLLYACTFLFYNRREEL